MKRLTLALLLALVASAVVAQPARNISSSTHPVTANVALAYDGTTGHLAKQAIAVLPKIVTVAQLPACSALYFGAIASVTDGNGATDCTTGLSTTDVACECNGSAWVARYTGTADLSAYVLITKAGQQSVTASGAGNDVSLIAADDVILTPADDLTVTAANDANLSTTAGNIGITAGGTTEDITMTSVDDITLNSAGDIYLDATYGSGTIMLQTDGNPNPPTFVFIDQTDIQLKTGFSNVDVAKIDVTPGTVSMVVDATGGDASIEIANTADIRIAGDGLVVDIGGSADEITVAAGSTTLTGSLILPVASAPPAACSAGTKGAIYFDSDISKLCVCNATNYVLVDDASTTTGCS